MAQVVERLLSKYEALILNYSTIKNKSNNTIKKKQKQKQKPNVKGRWNDRKLEEN
jgi:hypothetical protein